jgi:LDH2 family malate/lactate/ureidoglycolate dehydrogenase
MIIGIFCSVLSGVPWGPHINAMYTEMDQPRNLGHFVMAMDISRLLPLDQFKQSLGEMIDELHALPPTPGISKVLYPGELEGMRREQRARDGVPVDPGLYEELAGLGKRFGVPFPG